MDDPKVSFDLKKYLTDLLAILDDFFHVFNWITRVPPQSAAVNHGQPWLVDMEPL